MLNGSVQLKNRLASFCLAAAFLAAPASAFVRGGGTAPIGTASFTPSWQSLSMGGGGLMNNVQVATSDGTMVASQNTYGAVLKKTAGTCSGADQGGWGTTRAAPCWEQLFTQTSAPLTLTRVTQLQQGSLEIHVCNNNTNDAYAWYDQSLYVTTTLKSASSSRTWAKTPLTNTISGNQGISAGTGPTLACDPANPNLIYAATPAGLNVAVNGLSGASASFAVVSTAKVGVTGAIPSAIVFDPTSSTGSCAHYSGSPTCTLHFWVFTSGVGVKETYDGGNTFTTTASGPTTAGGPPSGPLCGQGGYCFTLAADPFGKVWATIGDAKLYKYTPNGTAGGGTWTNSTPAINNASVGYFGIDPTSASAGALRIVASYADGNFSVTTNGASTWSAWASNPFAASGAQPAWLGNANQAAVTYLAVQGFAFDTSGNLHAAAGIGMWSIASASVASGATWQADSVGIENMVATHIDAPSGNAPVVSVWDRGFFGLQNPDVYPTHYWPDASSSFTTTIPPIQGGWAIDWASSAPNTWTGWAGDSAPGYPATSSNGGSSWTVWASTSLGTINVGGNVAMSTPSNWLVIPSGSSGNLQFTTNGGTTFTAATITGITTPISAQKQNGFHLAADRVNANTFCLIDNAGKFYASTNSGSTWAFNGASIASTVKYNDALKAVPGQAGVFYYSGGNAGGSTTTFTLYKITKTTNECDTVTTVNAAITDVYGMGYGAAKPGGSGFPTIYFWGAVSGVYGLYEIDNGGTTPALLNVPATAQTWPNNSGDFINDVSGDMNFYGRVYVGHNGSSFTYIDKQDACPSVNFSNTLPNASLTGASVTLTAARSGLVPLTGVDFFLDGSTQIGVTQTGAGPYSVSFNASGQTVGAHTLTARASGNGCSNSGNSITIPITTH